MATMDYDDVDTAMDEIWKLHPAKAQFTRSGETAKWFRPRAEAMMSNRFNFKAYTSPSTGARSSDFATAAVGTAEFPAAQNIGYTELSYDYGDMTMIQVSVEINEIAKMRTENKKHAVYNLATKMFGEADLDAGSKINMMIHQSSACLMGTIAAIKDADGTAYTASDSTRYVYFQITDAQIGKFQKGMVIDITVAGGANIADAVIQDVIHGTAGPYIGGSRESDVGPGIVVDLQSGIDGDLIAADDTITLSNETTGDGFSGFADWFSTENVYNDAAGTPINRDLMGNAWSIPEILTIAAAGSEVVFDMDQHLAQLADILPQRIQTGRAKRKVDSEEGIAWGESLVAITTPKLANQATRDAADMQRFTSATALSADDAGRKRLFGEVGFEGMVWHSMTLGQVAIQADSVAAPHKVRILDPNSWNVLTMAGGMRSIEWLKTGGSRFVRYMGTNNRMTFTMMAGAFTVALLYCDQPGANAEITGVKSELD